MHFLTHTHTWAGTIHTKYKQARITMRKGWCCLMTTLFPPGISQEMQIPSSNLICHCILEPYLCLQTIFLCTWYTRLRAIESNRSESQSTLEKTQFGQLEKRAEAPPLVSRGVTVSLLECNCLSWANVRQGLPELCVLNNALIQAVAHLLVIWDGTSIRSQGRRPLVRSRGERRSFASYPTCAMLESQFTSGQENEKTRRREMGSDLLRVNQTEYSLF